MLHRIALLAGLVFAGAASAKDVKLVNPGFEDALGQDKSIPGWRKGKHAGKNVFEFDVVDDVAAKGKRSFRLSRKGEQVYATLDQNFPAKGLQGKTLEISLQVRSQAIGEAGFYPYLNLLIGNGGLADQIRGETITGTLENWKTIKFSVDVPQSVNELQLGLLLSDVGTVWVDDISVRIVGTAKNAGKKEEGKGFRLH